MNEKVLANKQETVKEIVKNFQESNSAVIVEYRGISVADMTNLRSQLREEGVDFKVYKNTLVRRATEQVGFEALDEILVGPNAISFSEDAVAPSRVLAKFAKKNRKLVIKQGVVEGRIVDLDAIKELASLPNKDGMVAMLLGALQSPIRQFAYAVSQIEPANGEETTEEVVEEAATVTEGTPETAAPEQEAVAEVVEETPEVPEETPVVDEVTETEVEAPAETVEAVVEDTQEEVVEPAETKTEEPEAAPEVAETKEEAPESAE